jgi:hypothetical protein
MAMIFKGYRPRIARRMMAAAPEDENIDLNRWLGKAIFAKTSNGYWLAWHDDEQLDLVLVLPPEDNQDKKCYWIESWDKNDTIETAIEYIESGRFAEDGAAVLNLFIQNPETGEWE